MRENICSKLGTAIATRAKWLVGETSPIPFNREYFSGYTPKTEFAFKYSKEMW